jgi:hypothetical protein
MMFYKWGPIHRAFGLQRFGPDEELSKYPIKAVWKTQNFYAWAMKSIDDMRKFEAAQGGKHQNNKEL